MPISTSGVINRVRERTLNMNVLMLSNEYPPYTYGGAGVHVEYLSKELAKLASSGSSVFW